MSRILRRIWRGLLLTLTFARDLIIANALVAWEVATPTHYMRPGIIAVPLEARTDLEITLFANMISLTPGTLSLDLSDDRTTLFVHGLHVASPEQLRADVRRLERRILRVLR